MEYCFIVELSRCETLTFSIFFHLYSSHRAPLSYPSFWDRNLVSDIGHIFCLWQDRTSCSRSNKESAEMCVLLYDMLPGRGHVLQLGCT